MLGGQGCGDVWVQGPFASATELAQAYKANNLSKCESPNWGKPAYNFTWATTFPFQPPQVPSDSTGRLG